MAITCFLKVTDFFDLQVTSALGYEVRSGQVRNIVMYLVVEVVVVVEEPLSVDVATLI